MTQHVTVQEIQDAGGPVRASSRAVPKPAKSPAKSAGLVPARGRRPQNRTVGYDADRMNKLEAQYAAHLEQQRLAGQIIFWRFEAIKFRLADRTWYNPDFYVMRPDGTIEIHETKGFMQDDANVKIKATADLFPEFCFVLVKWVRGAWQHKRYRAGQ